MIEHGAAKVYAGARDPGNVTDPHVVPVRLDVTDPDQVAAAAREAGDVQVVINNAGVAPGTHLFDGSLVGARLEIEVNYLGTWSMCRAFAPVLARNGGGALVNMLSVASWRTLEADPGYSASKSAQWSLTNALRLGLAGQGTLVVGVHCGFVDTDLAGWTDAPKIAPREVAEQAMQALLAGSEEVLADEVTRTVRANLSGDLGAIYQDALG